jgi:hypothetical protein
MHANSASVMRRKVSRNGSELKLFGALPLPPDGRID